MIRIKLHDVIANESHKWYYCWDDNEGVFSLAFVKKMLADNPDEKDFAFDIHCPGGEVEEGLAIYDVLRTSGRNIYTNIEGSCHSMALTLLLAAPLKNRTANPNCLALIHEVQIWAGGSVSEMERELATANMLQDKILDIYAERTGKDRAELVTIMNEQKERTADELLAWGFIGSINHYNTNFKTKKNNSHIMAKSLKSLATEFLHKVTNFVDAHFNYDFVDAEGKVLFSTEAEDDTLEVGMAATPDGSFTIADGRTITIAEGVITEIVEAPGEGEEGVEGGEGEGEGEEGGEGVERGNGEEAVTKLANLRAENAQLKSQLAEAANLIKDFRKNTKSNYQPGRRIGNAGKANSKNNVEPTREERKSAVKEALHPTKH